MQYRTLGGTGLKVSLLSQGTGGPSQFGQKRGLLQAEQNRLIRRCLDLGINAHLESNVRAMRNPTLDPADSARLKRLFGHIVEYA